MVTHLDNYQTLAVRTLNHKLSDRDQLAMLALGLGESGELQNIVKKYLYHGHELPTTEVMNELGDILWYVACMATVFGFDLSDIAEMNVSKLKARYPDGFSEADSVNRSN